MNLVKSHLPNKKYDALFYNTGKIVPFGDSNYSDYTLHGNEEKRRLYRLRHRNDNLEDPFSAGALSYYLLWGNSKRINENLKYFKKRFYNKLHA